MRNPAKSVRRLAGWEPMGWRLSRLLNDEARRSPALLQALGRMASEKEREAAIPVLETELQQSGARLAQAIAQDLGHPDVAGVVGPTGWRWQLLEIILTQAGDPDIDVAQWLRGRTPLGVLTEITPRGIFPNTEQTAAQAASWEFYQQRTRDDVEGNYTSYKEHPDESAGELRRLVAAGHVEEIGTWADVKARWPNALATKLATLVKVRADGSSKVRFVVDMRRSGINGLSKCRERNHPPAWGGRHPRRARPGRRPGEGEHVNCSQSTSRKPSSLQSEKLSGATPSSRTKRARTTLTEACRSGWPPPPYCGADWRRPCQDTHRRATGRASIDSRPMWMIQLSSAQAQKLKEPKPWLHPGVGRYRAWDWPCTSSIGDRPSHGLGSNLRSHAVASR